MANPEHLKILKQGVKAWNNWRFNNLAIAPNLTGANLKRAELSGANLREADLSGAKLRGANLSHANFTEANLRVAKLRGANLRGANLSHANFTEANLRHADLSETIFANIDLSNVINLDSCIHIGPSIIDHRTLLKSGNLPEVFLRGCGLPDFIIENISVLREDPLQYYSCFISYSTKDQEFAERLHADLQNNGVRCWFAPHDLIGGKKIYDQVNQAIRTYDKLLLILSENSMNSDWVAQEIKTARKREKKEDRQMFFPITLINYEELTKWDLFDAATVTNLTDEVREYYIPDFSNWKDHDSYKESFDRILRDLKGES